MTHPKRLLLVDDEQEIRRMLRRILEAKGYEVVGEAENGSLGVQAAIALSPDVVVMDLAMPAMNGIEATAAIKKGDEKITVIMYTAYADESFRSEAAKAGASGWVLKGAPPAELFKMLEGAV